MKAKKKSPRPDGAAPPRPGEMTAEARGRDAQSGPSDAETRQLLRDLDVQQIRLEIQHRELRQAHEELEGSRARYFDLYEFAPVGYLSLSDQGIILGANLTIATMLGVAKVDLLDKPLAQFIVREDQGIHHLFHPRLPQSGVSHVCQLRLMRVGALPFWARIEATAARDANGTFLCRAVVSDITSIKRLEEERELNMKVLDRINSSSSPQMLLWDVTVLIRDWVGCEAVGLRLRDGEDFPYFETTGLSAGFVKAENSLCRKDSHGGLVRDSHGMVVLGCMCGDILSGRCDRSQPFFTARGSFWTNSATKQIARATEGDGHACTLNRCHDEGYESVALIPMRAGGTIFGLMQCNDKRPGLFTPGKIAHLEQIADHFAVALARWQAEERLRISREHLRALAARVQTVREEERTRVAREIHDVLAQELTSLKIDTVLLTRLLARPSAEQDQDAIAGRLARMATATDTAIHSVQKIATDLRPVVLDSLGLCAAIEWQAADFQTRTGISCKSGLPAHDIPLDPDRSTALFRIFQESLTNVVRHAEATQVEVCLRCEDGSVTLTVSDNGRGIQASQVHAPGAVGLLGMRERASLLGGRCDIVGRPGQGTTVMAQLPSHPRGAETPSIK